MFIVLLLLLNFSLVLLSVLGASRARSLGIVVDLFTPSGSQPNH